MVYVFTGELGAGGYGGAPLPTHNKYGDNFLLVCFEMKCFCVFFLFYFYLAFIKTKMFLDSFKMYGYGIYR